MREQTIKVRVNVVATLRDAITGKILKITKQHNTIPTTGRTAMASWLSSASPSPATIRINYCALGSGTNAPANGDTTLQTETYRNLIASETNANNIAYFSGFFSATETSGTYREAGLFIAGTGSANSGTLFSRVAVNITKSGSNTLTLDWTVTIS